MKNLILCFALVLSFYQIAFPQNVEKLTPIEKVEVRKVVNRFIKFMDEQGDVTLLVTEIYANDFIERNIKERKKYHQPDEKSPPVDLWFLHIIKFNSSLLYKASLDDWKSLYIATLNYLSYGNIISNNRSAKYIVRKKEPPDKIYENFYPPEIVKFINTNPFLKNITESQGTAETINTVEEMQSVTDTLTEAMKLPPTKKTLPTNRLSNDSKKLIKILSKDKIFNENVQIVKGVREITDNTSGFSIDVINIGGKYKIIWTGPGFDN